MLVLVMVGASGFWVRQRLQREEERELAAELSAVLDTAAHGLLGFLEDNERLGGVVANSLEVRAAIQPALSGSRQPNDDTLARVLAPYLAAGQFTGFALTDTHGVVLANSSGFGSVGDRLAPTVLPIEEAGRSARAVFGLPFRDSGGHVRVVLAAPVRDAPAFLGLMREHRPFTASLLAARAGSTGETYAFDGHGLMISSSRFPHHLRAAGLLGPDDEESALLVELRDPGGDLTTGFRSQVRRRDQPLTFMAAAATAGRDGLSITPYRDYRGVPVVGAWRWLSDRHFGIASEIDADQAFQSLYTLERLFATLLVLLALAGAAAVAGAAVAERARLRAVRSEHEARRLGAYVIERRLGTGAMGEVFLAQHALLRRPTALKVLRQDRMNAEAIERFEREVRVSATLSHPNTIAIYDYGRTDRGAFYYAMEFLHGIDLDRLVKSFGPQPEARVIHLLRQACGALGEAHEAGLVHRDIKLANLYLCARGGVPDVLKVLDFGLAKAADAGRLTHDSVVLGTPENMAPELFESADNASPLTDVYALACVGYALLTGRRPFEGSSLAELCKAHLSKRVVPPSERLNRAVDPALERVILACLAKRPAERPQSTNAIVSLLERSPLASAWTRADADAFWATHQIRIEDIVQRQGALDTA
jgi:tRNA A-37 threonylcarbamoyl transferase component Bud32